MRKSFSSLVLVTGFSLTACSMKTLHRDSSEETSAKIQHQMQNEASSSHEVSREPATPTPAMKTGHLVSAAHPVTPTASMPTAVLQAPAPRHQAKGVDPAKALGWLKNGNTRFVKGHLRKDGQSAQDIQRLSTGQNPHTIVLSCSDSRVPPEVIFDQKLGEIFVIRNAGEIPEAASIASIEYAVEHLGTRLIVVMGHTSCGAVKAALATMEGADAGSPSLNQLVHDIHPRLESFRGKTPSPGVEFESRANAQGIAKALLDRSEILRNKAASGEVVIQSALYHLDDGKVDFNR